MSKLKNISAFDAFIAAFMVFNVISSFSGNMSFWFCAAGWAVALSSHLELAMTKGERISDAGKTIGDSA